MPGDRIAYCAAGLDRAGAHRGDPERLDALLAAPGARIIPFWQDHCLVAAGRPVELPGSPPVAPADRPAFPDGTPAPPPSVVPMAGPVLLGLDGTGAALFAVDLSTLPRAEALALAGADAAVDLRQLFPSLDHTEAAVLAHARGLLHWHRRQRYCGACGGVTHSSQGGASRTCPGCGTPHFPRIEPAVIVLVESAGPPARCLLGRHRAAPPGSFATLAGFVEVGESLEDAVRREVAEEAGVRVGPVSYRGSQAWPFPAGLMVGFRARATDDRIRVDQDELLEARWFTRAQLRDLLAQRPPRPDSIERHLLLDWLAEPGSVDPPATVSGTADSARR
jgi:NAD+ diphosphatase